MLAPLLVAAFAVVAQPASATPPLEAEVAAVQRIARGPGEALWPGFGGAPFGTLLLERDREVLLCHPTSPPGFAPAGRDPATGCARLERPRSRLPAGLLAAMPLFGPPSTIVVGTPEAAGVSLARWRSSVLHEHFHQWQSALPAYYARVAALDLAGGDETGMWMLNFAFPYTDARTVAAHAAVSRALAEALEARGGRAFRRRLSRYVAARRAFAAAAGARNWRYLEFQLWQEGVARWTEIALGRAAGDPAAAAEADARERETLAELRSPDLAGQKRLAVYAMGAGEAMLLAECGNGWRARYPELLSLGPLVEAAGRRCRPSRRR